MTDAGFRSLTLATAALFAAMALASPMECGGVWRLCSFDAQIVPYSPAEARDYLAAIGPAIWRYRWIVQPLDLVFPAALCLLIREAAARWAPERRARRLGKVAVAYAGIDYLENAVVRLMLESPGGDFPDIAARGASGLTVSKWLVLAVLGIALALLWLRRRTAA